MITLVGLHVLFYSYCHQVCLTAGGAWREAEPDRWWFNSCVCVCVWPQWEELRSLATSCRRRSRAEWLSGQTLLGDVSSSRGMLRFRVGVSPVRIMLLISCRRWWTQRTWVSYYVSCSSVASVRSASDSAALTSQFPDERSMKCHLVFTDRTVSSELTRLSAAD